MAKKVEGLTQTSEKLSFEELFLKELERVYGYGSVMVEGTTRRMIVINGIQTATLVSKQTKPIISLYLAKFKPEVSTFDEKLRANLVSYGAGGFYFNAPANKGGVSKAVRAIKFHYKDLLRVKNIRERGF